VRSFSLSNIINVLLRNTVALSFLFAATQGMAQDVRLTNPSFEDTPRQGKFDERTNFRSEPIKGWFDCGSILFPTATPPDIHKGSSFFWDNELSTAHGKTYITLVVREDDSYETVSQRVKGTLKAENCYNFSISLARSKKYMSPTKGNNRISNFNQPAVLRIWGGSSSCDIEELLAESEPVANTDWEEYKFKIEPTSDHTHITLEAFFKTPVLFVYNGNVCIDNASMFKLIDCDQEEVLLAQVKPKKKETKVVPSFKKKKKEKVYTTIQKPKIDTITEQPRKLGSFKREEMRIGMLIKMNKVTFPADSIELGPHSYEILDQIVDFLKTYEEISIEVGGHTNSKPPDNYCDKISTSRAKAVAEYLINKGIAEPRVAYKGYGKRRPIATNKTPAGRLKNQRVQIMITSLDYKNR